LNLYETRLALRGKRKRRHFFGYRKKKNFQEVKRGGETVEGKKRTWWADS